MIGPQQFWLGTVRAGQTVTFWIDTTTVHLSTGGWRIKTVPSRLTEVDLARLRRAGARPAGSPPSGPFPGTLAASRCVEVDRLVNSGGIMLAAVPRHSKAEISRFKAYGSTQRVKAMPGRK
jgi:hypothetical protein